jgi:epoxyqueuosine reductase QueG
MPTAETLREEIARFVRENPENRRRTAPEPYFDEPLVGFASAADPLFAAYKGIIGPFHLTPAEVFEEAYGPGSLAAGTVICWVLPVARAVRESNRREERLPSRDWAHTRNFGEHFNDSLRRHVVSFLGRAGHRAVAPHLSPRWKRLDDTPVGIASTWSERHAAYAAGLGTFSLNDALITPRGIAHRLGSAVTDLVLEPSPRTFRDYRENCLTCRGQECGVCITRCPAGAISQAGHDKEACRRYSYGVVMEAVGAEYGVEIAGCGLCQTRVPCESRIPRGRGARAGA